ncbi:methylated-DNA--[protein]-cysteine S-methyltransferase [Ferrimonas balearica]|uniref:methylated-DNA--[protein]-cysteine S-methyltransferase n=1 Tax=Ferrimonas balearica TaxID=44012 RepID=UPI0028F71E3B|nr:methylated-DNA--[protein]-cysteine S-methyltransferase [Ferrimonas balearica]
MKYDLLDTPTGTMIAVIDEVGLRHLNYQQGPKALTIDAEWEHDPEALAPYLTQLREYFSGERKAFSFPLSVTGTEFQQKVWRALCAIPYGKIVSYRDIARLIGRPSAVRAVGAANGRNPLHVVIPCHRVVATSGALTGYAGGLSAKQKLLLLEQKRR